MIARLTATLILAVAASAPQQADVKAAPPLRLAVVVSRSNPATNVSLADLRRIYSGALTRWPAGSHIVPVVPDPSSYQGQMFLRRIVEMTDIDFAQQWIGIVFRGQSPAPPHMARSDSDALLYVSKHQAAIGLVSADRVDDTVKMLTVDEKQPADRDYPLSW